MRIAEFAAVERSLKQLRKESQEIKSGCAGDTIFSAKAIMFICERLVQIEDLLKSPPKPKRKPSAWNRFFAAGMKAGKSPKQIAEEWQKRRGGGAAG